MVGFGTILNVIGVLVGGICGMLFGKRFSPRYQETLTYANGLCVVFLGVAGTLEKMMTVENGYLTISAAKGFEKDEAENEEEQKEGRYIRKERYCGSCERSFYVGDGLTVEDIKANFKHGILSLSIPKKDRKQIANNKYIAIEG